MNPSIADEYAPDATMRRVQRFAEDLNYGGFIIGNVFALVAKDPQDLKLATNPVGEANDCHLQAITRCTESVVVGWGKTIESRQFQERRTQVKALLGASVKALSINLGGSPKHPLYIRASAAPIIYSWPSNCDI